jgi:flagellar protein FliO/FliZ
MKIFRNIVLFCLFISFCLYFADSSIVSAAEDAASTGGYLSGYQDVDPHPTQTSWWSTLAYLVSLLVVFMFVLVMAYLASRFLGGRFAKATVEGSGKILENLPLGPNRSVCVVELAGKVVMLGVTEQSITLLQEITDPQQIETLRSKEGQQLPVEGFEQVFAEQFKSLDKISRRIPALFKDGRYRK